MGALAAFVIGFAVPILTYVQYLPATMEAITDVVPGVEGVYFDRALSDALYIVPVWGLIASITARVDVDGRPLDTRHWFGLFSRLEWFR